MNKYTKINDILRFSDIHPADHRFILGYILELKKENQKLKKQYCERNDCVGRLGNSKKVEKLIKENKDLHQRINYATDRLEALIVFWKKYNPVDNYMQVEQFNGVIDILNGENND